MIKTSGIYCSYSWKSRDTRLLKQKTEYKLNKTRNEKGTKVSISVKEEREEILVEVKDDGVGITKEIAGEIFIPFVKGDAGRKSKEQGSGLGLTITQKIVEAHGGQIILNQLDEVGCTFLIRLPKATE